MTYTNREPRPTQKAGPDIWARLGWVWLLLFFPALLVPAVIALNDGDLSADQSQRVIVLTLLFIVWQSALLLYLWRFHDPGHYMALMILYTGVALILWFMLVQVHPIFFFMLLSLFGLIFTVLPLRYAIVANIILVLLLIYLQVSQNGGEFTLDNPTIWLYVLIGAFGIFVGIWINAIIVQSGRRRELIEVLQATQADLAEAEREAGRLAERQRLAREIHDTLAQGFTSIVMHLEAADQALPDELPTVEHHLDQSRQIARRSLGEARRVVADLRPELLEKDPLPQAISRVVDRWSRQSGIKASSITTGQPLSLHPQVEATLLRATQEALANCQKHSKAGEVRLTLSYMDDVVVLDVQDDGVGLSDRSPTAPGSGYGLQAMRERVAMLDGTLLLESAPGEGTTLVLEIPLDGHVEPNQL